MTAYDDIDARIARGAGFNVFLRKPIDPDQLCHAVALLIAQSKTKRHNGEKDFASD